MGSFSILSRQYGQGISPPFTSQYTSATAHALVSEVPSCCTKCFSNLQNKNFNISGAQKGIPEFHTEEIFKVIQMCLSKKCDFQPTQVSMVLVLLLTSPQTGLSISKVNQTHNSLQGRNPQFPRFSHDVPDPINPNNWSLRGDGQQCHAVKLWETTVTQHSCCKEADSTSAQRGHEGGLCFT